MGSEQIDASWSRPDAEPVEILSAAKSRKAVLVRLEVTCIETKLSQKWTFSAKLRNGWSGREENKTLTNKKQGRVSTKLRCWKEYKLRTCQKDNEKSNPWGRVSIRFFRIYMVVLEVGRGLLQAWPRQLWHAALAIPTSDSFELHHSAFWLYVIFLCYISWMLKIPSPILKEENPSYDMNRKFV